MSQVLFYIVPDGYQPANGQESNIPAHFDYACRLCARLYREDRRKIYIYTEDQKQAELVDEHLWQFDAESFVAHNLQGEGPRFGAPVEIGCEPPKSSRPILINLSQSLPDFVQRFHQIFDFVPADEQLKQLARDRYKQYRAAGHQLDTTPAV